MARVNWINGTIKPPETGRYYVISEAVTDYHWLKKGDVVVSIDEWLPVLNKWGYYNIHFRILAWAPMIYPDIPADLQGKVKWYFGEDVESDWKRKCLYNDWHVDTGDFCSCGEKRSDGK